MKEKFKLTDEEVSRINKLVNEMEFEPRYVCETGFTVRELKLRGQQMEVYIQVRVVD